MDVQHAVQNVKRIVFAGFNVSAAQGIATVLKPTQIGHLTELCGWGAEAVESINKRDFIIEYVGEGRSHLTISLFLFLNCITASE
ncbi:Histone-lysine N-methyltransferase ASHR3-like protein [Drosera capensis]